MTTYHSHQQRWGERFEWGVEPRPCRKVCCRWRFRYHRDYFEYVVHGWPPNGAAALRKNREVLDLIAALGGL